MLEREGLAKRIDEYRFKSKKVKKIKNLHRATIIRESSWISTNFRCILNTHVTREPRPSPSIGGFSINHEFHDSMARET